MDGKQGNLLRDPEIIARAQKDNSVLEQLIPEGVKLVGFCYWRYFGGDRRIQRTFMQREDLLQDGLLGFLEAVKRFDPSLGDVFDVCCSLHSGTYESEDEDYGAPFMCSFCDGEIYSCDQSTGMRSGRFREKPNL